MFSGLLTRSRTSGQVALLGALLLTPLLSGCGKQKQPWETVYPAKGIVTFKGKPIANAEIALFPQGDSMPDTVRPKGKTTEAGEFVVWTYQQGDGAPAGNYKVTVVHHDVVEQRDVLITKPNDLPRKYATLETTDLEVVIGQNETEIPPIDLK